MTTRIGVFMEDLLKARDPTAHPEIVAMREAMSTHGRDESYASDTGISSTTSHTPLRGEL